MKDSSWIELDGPFLTVFLPEMEIWAVVTKVIEENVLESGWLRLKDESQHKDKFLMKFCLVPVWFQGRQATC